MQQNHEFDLSELDQKMLENFLGYLRINTQSNPHATSSEVQAYKQRFITSAESKIVAATQDANVPTSEGQFILAEHVAHQLEALGCDVSIDSNAIVVATLEANTELTNLPKLILFAHLDTALDQSGDVSPRVIQYEGGDIPLSSEAVLRLSEFPELARYVGDQIVVTDGTSLLGADDKAAITAVVQCIDEIRDEPHGEIRVVLLPDEEIGLLGAKALDIAALEIDARRGDFGICLDCCGAGEYVVNNWNAGKASVEFSGRSAHPMNAKNNMKNAVLMANDFINLLPAAERPEHTENDEGYFWVKQVEGDTNHARLDILIREFDGDVYIKRKEYLEQCTSIIESKYDTSVVLTMSDDYPSISNFSSSDESIPSIQTAQQRVASTIEALGIQPIPLTMRGGYDGCIITKKGLPTVNLFTGAHNFHSIYEYQPLGSLRKAVNVLKALASGCLVEKEGA